MAESALETQLRRALQYDAEVRQCSGNRPRIVAVLHRMTWTLPTQPNLSEPERLVHASLRHVEAIASVLPLDAEDERIVDELMAKRAARLGTRPLRRREGDPR